MSEESTPPKKMARKRTVKKGVRGQRAPRKKTITKQEDSPVDDEEMTYEKVSSEESSPADAPSEPSSEKEPEPEQEPTIAVVDETAEAPAKKQSKPKKKQSGERKEEEDSDEEDDKKEGRRRGGRNRRSGNSREREEAGPRRNIDRDEAAAKAWEIYQGELEEEGVILVDPRRGREIARRCLELATVFCEERDKFLER